YDWNSIFLLFNRYRSTEYQVVKVNAGPGFVENFVFQTIDRFLITDFKTLGYSAFMAGTIRDEPVLLFSDLQTGKSKILPISTKGVDRKSTRLNSSHVKISYAVFCLKKKNKKV